MTASLDLDRYFARIGYTGPRAATLDVLRALHALHPLAIPFENLDPLQGRPVALDLGAIVAKLVTANRGGYCFEHNKLFAQALTQLGFSVTPLLARVLWGQGADAVTPLTHMLLRVEVDGQAWIADVGFGGVTLTTPLRLQAGDEQATSHETFRLTQTRPDAFDLEVACDAGWASVYRFATQRAEWVDYEIANWYTSTAPDSLFVNHLLACRVLPAGRLALFDTGLTERDAQGRAVAERAFANADELARCLRERFGIALDGVDVAAVFARIAPAQGGCRGA